MGVKCCAETTGYVGLLRAEQPIVGPPTVAGKPSFFASPNARTDRCPIAIQ